MKKFLTWKVLIVAVVIGGGLGIGAGYIAHQGEVSDAEATPINLSIPQAATGDNQAKPTNDPPRLVKPKVQKAKPKASTTSSTSSQAPASTTPSSAPTKQTSTSTTAPKTDASSSEEQATVKPDYIYVGTTAIHYENGGIANGQQIIDSDPDGVASTWGGKTPFSGTDGMNTHFIGHHWGAFDCMIPLKKGAIISVTDDKGNEFSYKVEKKVIVDTHAIDVSTGKNYYSEITSTGGGERITVQTCTSETEREILFAYPA